MSAGPRRTRHPVTPAARRHADDRHAGREDPRHHATGGGPARGGRSAGRPRARRSAWLPHRAWRWGSRRAGPLRRTGIKAVTSLRLRQWWRRPRAPLVLAAYVLAPYGPAILVWLATAGSDPALRGMLVHSLTVCGLLAGVLGGVPLLAAAAFADRDALDALDTLRVTPLRPGEIVAGHLLAALAVPVAGAAAALPLLLLAAATGGAGPGGPLLAPLALSVVAASAASLGLLASAVTRRRGVALALTYVALLLLCLGPPAAYGALTAATERLVSTRVVQRAPPSADGPACREVTAERPRRMTDRTWWLLAPSPVVLVADAAPSRLAPQLAFEPLDAVRHAVRSARSGPVEPLVECRGDAADAARRVAAERERAAGTAAVWPWGVAALAALGAGCAGATARRISAPGVSRRAGRRTAPRRRPPRRRRDGCGR